MIRAVRQDAIDRALAVNDIAGAAKLAEIALAAGETGPMLLNLAAWRREEAGDYAAAHDLLQRALLLSPDDPTIVAGIGTVLRKAGRLAEAMRYLDAATRLDASFAVPWLERGFALDAGGSTQAAADSYARAAALDPQCAPAFAGVAAIAVRSGEVDAARAHATRALALDPREPTATLALAAIDLERGAAEAAAERARMLVRRGDLAVDDRIAALTLLGDALDRQDAAAEAFAAYTAAQAATAAHYAPAFAGRISHRAFVERLTAAVDRLAPPRQAAPPPVPGEAAGHVFLLGYPRSGTTLTENILASSPHVDALEERPTLAAADAAFFTDADGLDRLAALGDVGAAALRAAYWANVAACGVATRRKVFVDMDPLKGIKLPAIARLFPAAHILVMRRDPRDVVLGCFRRNFRIGAATYEFTALERTARHYDAVMRLMQRCIETMPLRLLEVRYDDLVADFDGVTATICRRIGVPWSPSLRAFDRTARRRGVATASATQVRRGLYDGSGAWRRYAAQLEPVMPILAPWIERFGFAA